MTDEEFEALPYGGEGLWRKFMHASRREATLEDILTSVKSKRYTRTRLDRMMMCAYLGITAEILAAPAPYIRVLAFNEKGRAILSAVKKAAFSETPEKPSPTPISRWNSAGATCTDCSLWGSRKPPAQSSAGELYLRRTNASVRVDIPRFS